MENNELIERENNNYIQQKKYHFSFAAFIYIISAVSMIGNFLQTLKDMSTFGDFIALIFAAVSVVSAVLFTYALMRWDKPELLVLSLILELITSIYSCFALSGVWLIVPTVLNLTAVLICMSEWHYTKNKLVKVLIHVLPLLDLITVFSFKTMFYEFMIEGATESGIENVSSLTSTFSYISWGITIFVYIFGYITTVVVLRYIFNHCSPLKRVIAKYADSTETAD